MPDLRDRLQTVLAAKYRIVRELTGGGMSRVFLATDEHLQREVVVKVLSPEQLDEARVERFRQEVLQTARLQHPTIVPIIDVGAIEDAPGHRLPFYIMPYAKGESLRSRIHHEGQVSLSVAMRVLRGVFDALAYAHAHGVVHRDIKPENIFLSGSNALLADFGIAKAISGPGSHSGVTMPGMAVGTPTYMAPEQLVDPDRVGPRTDLYAAGVVGYEMLAGRLPWGTTTPVEMLASRARDRITPLRSLRPDVPAGVAAVIEACLAWEPDRRPESAASALQAIESVPVRPTPDTSDAIALAIPAPRSRPPRRLPRATLAAMVIVVGVLAVLVRSKITGQPTEAPYRRLAVLYPDLPTAMRARSEIAERLFHMLTSTLAPVSGLRLVGRVSVPRMTEQGLSLPQIAESLNAEGVDSVLTFEVASSADAATTLAIVMRGVNEMSGETVAGPISVSALDRLSPDSLSLIVRRLAAQSVARLKLASANHAVSETQRVDAYMAWLSGRDAMSSRTPAGLRRAVEEFERAIALDSLYAQAHADLAQTMALALVYHYRMKYSPFDLAARSLRLADRAVQLRPEFADGYLARGLIGTTAGAPLSYIKINYETVARLLSANPYSQTWYLGLLGKQGQFADAVDRAEEEVRLDPHSVGQRVASALYALPAGQYSTAIRNAAESRGQVAGDPVPILSQLELWGRLLVGRNALGECAEIPAGPYLGARALCLERTGRTAEGTAMADSLLARLIETATDSTFDFALPMGEMALYLEQHEDRPGARQWLREAFGQSPAGVDYRLMRSEMFEPEEVAMADSLQLAAWGRVVAASKATGR